MTKLSVITLVSMLLTCVSALAHHPAADIVDPVIYEMITDNISEQHLDLTFDDMNGATTTQSGDGERSRDNDDSQGMGADTANTAEEAVECEEDEDQG